MEYFSFALRLDHLHTTGGDACDGCSVPVCLGFPLVSLVTTTGSRILNTGSGASTAGWQGGITTNYIVALFRGRVVTRLDCAGAVPVRRSSWGEVKALYH